MGESHVIVHERQDLSGVIAGKSQTAADFPGNLYPHIYVVIEADAIRGPAESWRLPHIVK
jgi:hypothetical protein